ncbi:hypothetical protein NGK65_06425 [Serratia ureilytica]|uniref:hypothetical protein n=1 Tax=Serratia ureilytica TaxID=300181 RepID=UPI002DB5D01B|nr:hypothetical protein [Serratia ureilytica]MEB7893369.1 hypothetical protein [Serratia ureilytica]
MDKSSGLVRHYVEKIGQIGARRQMGESMEILEPKIDAVLQEAHEHFAIWVDGTPEDNWAYLISQVNFNGRISDERYREVMTYASDAARKKTPPKRPTK